MTPEILVLYAHPHPRRSRLNQALVAAVEDLEHVTTHRLYEVYPDFQIDVEHEQELLLAHDVIVFQHPFYWYSSPAMLKEWQDAVLLNGFAFGEGGTALTGKHFQSVITAGGSQQAYSAAGSNHFTVEELLRPFEQTAHLCHMRWQPPRTLLDSTAVSHEALQQHCVDYRDFLQNYRFDKED